MAEPLVGGDELADDGADRRQRDGELDAGADAGQRARELDLAQDLAGVAPMARTIRICSGSADFSPVTVFTITGKKVKATTKNISLCSPKPNQTRNSGAMTTLGMAWAITSHGVSMRSTRREPAMAAPAARPKRHR